MNKIDPELKRLYVRVLKQGWSITECFRWKDGSYTISIEQPSHWPRGEHDPYQLEDIHLEPR